MEKKIIREGKEVGTMIYQNGRWTVKEGAGTNYRILTLYFEGNVTMKDKFSKELIGCGFRFAFPSNSLEPVNSAKFYGLKTVWIDDNCDIMADLENVKISNFNTELKSTFSALQDAQKVVNATLSDAAKYFQAQMKK